MKKYSTIQRLEIILQLLEGYAYLSKNQLQDRLVEDYELEVAARTLERDLKALDTSFGIEVNYDREQRGYKINARVEERVVSFLKFAGRIHLGKLFQESLKDFDSLRDAVSTEDQSNFEGLAHIEPLLIAIQEERQVRFVHENYVKETFKNYCISPLQLKEFQGRWYVVGVPENEEKIKTFGLARISELNIESKAKIPVADFRPQLNNFLQVIGLNYDAAEKVEHVEIAVTENQYKYLKSLPLHQSQEFLGDYKNGRKKLGFWLLPNYELEMQLYKMGNQVEVLAPPSLRKKVKRTLTQTLKLYTNE